VRDDPTLHFVLDGVRAYARGKRVRADVFDLRYVNYGREGLSDDRTDGSRRFSGVTFGYVVPNDFLGSSKLFFDPFVWRLRNRAAVWGRQTAREERMFYGLHLYGDVDRATIDWTVNYQGGEFNDRKISAWQAFLAQTWRVGKAASAPRVGVHVDYASGGGGSSGQGDLRTPSGLYGNNIYYSYQLFLTPTNLIAISPNVTVQPIKNLRVTAEYTMAYRPNEDEAVYRASGAAFANTQNVAGKHIADLIRLQAVWALTPRVSLTGRYEHMMVKDALANAGYRNSDFLAGWVSFPWRAAALWRDLMLLPADYDWAALHHPLTRSLMQDFLLELWEENRKTVLLVTHDVQVAAVRRQVQRAQAVSLRRARVGVLERRDERA